MAGNRNEGDQGPVRAAQFGLETMEYEEMDIRDRLCPGESAGHGSWQVGNEADCKLPTLLRLLLSRYLRAG